MKRALIFLGVALLSLLGPENVFAQGCALCYTTAAGGGKLFLHAIQSGVIVLLVPPVLIFSGLVLLITKWQSLRAEN